MAWKRRQRILGESGQKFGELETSGSSHLETSFLELQNNSADVETGEILEPQTVLDSTDLFCLPDDDVPSVCTDFQVFAWSFVGQEPGCFEQRRS